MSGLHLEAYHFPHPNETKLKYTSVVHIPFLLSLSDLSSFLPHLLWSPFLTLSCIDCRPVSIAYTSVTKVYPLQNALFCKLALQKVHHSQYELVTKIETLSVQVESQLLMYLQPWQRNQSLPLAMILLIVFCLLSCPPEREFGTVNESFNFGKTLFFVKVQGA